MFEWLNVVAEVIFSLSVLSFVLFLKVDLEFRFGG